MSKKNYKKNPWGIPQPSKVIKNNAAYENSVMLNYYLNMMSDIALARYKWKNIPDSISKRFMEVCCLYYGKFIAWKDDIADQITIAPFSVEGQRDQQGRPIFVRANSPYTGFTKRINVKEEPCAICWNNYIQEPDINGVILFAQRMADTQRTIDINIKGQKTPKYIVVNKYQELTVENIVGETEMNCPVIYLKESSINPEQLKQIDLTVPYNADKLDIHQLYIWSDFLSFMGIDNSNQYKKERTVAAEATQNEENVEMSRNTNLDSRKQFCDDFNNVFSEYDIDVEFNSLITKANLYQKLNGVDFFNGSIYDNPV